MISKIENGDAGATFQQRVQPWMLACFGELIASDREERNHRFLEEALELVQATGCTASEARQLVDYVYGRPVGEPAQEVGGVMVTLAALCLANDLDMHQCGETELVRIWTKVEAIRAKQAAKPKHSPLPAAHASAPVAASTDLVVAAQALLAEHEEACLTDPMFALVEMAEDDEDAEVSAVLLADLFRAVRVLTASQQHAQASDPIGEHNSQAAQEKLVEHAHAVPKCKNCGGTGVVDDGEIDCYPNGEPFMHGPVKCVKDCPDCSGDMAVLAQPVAGELPPLPTSCDGFGLTWTEPEAKAIRIYGHQCRAAALERTGNAAHQFALEQLDPDRLQAGLDCEAVIRALNKTEGA
ncbi:hypothetical protein [Duganella callida]|uniref:hypothetical protein n=1 Tax=Duganella callida TaxID=2561932 RepID=UPI001E51DCD5|nr:hypothetical protein [Duganella callida]